MTVRYTISFRDLMAFCFQNYSRSPLVIVVYGTTFLVVSHGLVHAIPADRPFLVKVITFLLMEIVAFCFVAGFFSFFVVLSVISKRNKTFLTEHVLTLGEEAIFDETSYCKTEFKWAGVQKLSRTRKYIFIYAAQYAAHVVPRRAFRDEAEWDSFYEFCRRKTARV